MPEIFPNRSSRKICILWADVAGFSALSANVAAETDGRESVTRAVNDLIASCLEISLAQGAELINLGGDSWIVAWYPVTPDSVKLAAIVATQSHFQCQRVSTVHGMDIKIRIACVYGQVYRYSVELDEGRSNLILHGELMRQACELLAGCKPGSTIFSQDEFALDTTEHHADDMVHTHAKPHRDSLHRAQRGVCTVTFVSVRLQDLPDDEVELVVQNLAQAARTLCARFNAILARIRIDEKGCHVLILAGFGKRAADDGARHALVIARSLSKSAQLNKLPMSIALCSGKVFACEVGYPPLVEFTVMGECVNLAAQIAASHKNGIRLDALSVETSACVADIESWTDFVPKGMQRAQPVATLSIHHATDLGEQEGVTNSRSQRIERQQTKNIAAMLKSQHSWVALIGDAGAGKSVALNQIAYSLRTEAGKTILTGRCTSEHALGYAGAASQIMIDWVHCQAATNEDRLALIRRVYQMCPSDIRSAFTRLIAALPIFKQTGLESSQQPISQPQTISFFAWWAHHFLSSNYVVVMEDLHWIDDVSAACLFEISKSAANVSCIGSSRKSISQKLLLHKFSEWHLSTLDSAEVADLACSLLGVKSIDAEVIDHVMQLTGGNCMFTAKWLPEGCLRGWYKKTADGLILSLPALSNQHRSHDPPVVLHLLLQSQFERLSDDSKSLSTAVSVYGKAFPSAHFRKLFSDGQMDVDACLAECVDNGILWVDQDHQNGHTVQFEHALLSEVCYVSLDANSRAVHHHKMARLLDVESSINSDPMELAWHWMRSEVKTPQSLEKIFEGAMWARRVNSVDVALNLFGCLVDFYKSQGVLAHTLYKRAYLWFVITECQKGKTPDSTAHLKQAASLLYSGTPNKLQAFFYLVRHVCNFAKTYVHTVGRFSSSRAFKTHEDPAALSLLLLAETNYFQGNFELYQWHAICALDAAEQTQSTRDMISAYAGMSVQMARLGLGWLSDAYAYVSMRLSRQAKEPVFAVETLFFLALRDLGSARWHRTQRHIAIASQLNYQLSGGRRNDELLVVQGYLFEGKGDLDAASRVYDALWKSGLRREDLQTRVWGYLGCVRVAHLQGATAKSDEFLGQLALIECPDVLSRLEYDALTVLQVMKRRDYGVCEAILERWPLSTIKDMAKTTFSVGFPIVALYLAAQLLRLHHKESNHGFQVVAQRYLQVLKTNAKFYEYSLSRYWMCSFIHNHLNGNRIKSKRAMHMAQATAYRLQQSHVLERIHQIQNSAFDPDGKPMEWLLASVF